MFWCNESEVKNISNYTYRNPLEHGFKQGHLTKKQHNSIFQYRQINWKTKYEYYYNHDELILQKLYSLPILILETLLFPINIFVVGFANIKELLDEIKGLYKPKKYGSFVGDSCYWVSDQYKKFIEYQK